MPCIVDDSDAALRISSGVSSETPMASTVALMIASVSSSQTKPDESKSLWPSLTSKKYRGHIRPPVCQVLPDSNVRIARPPQATASFIMSAIGKNLSKMRGGQLEKRTARRTELMVAGMSDLPQRADISRWAHCVGSAPLKRISHEQFCSVHLLAQCYLLTWGGGFEGQNRWF
jgi:hypothetical protein